MSFQNLNMLLATIPSMDEDEDEKEKKKKEEVKELNSMDELAEFLAL